MATKSFIQTNQGDIATSNSSTSRERNNTKALFENMKVIIPGGVSSPVRSCFSLGVTPLIVESGKGAEIIDIDGNRYIDFCMSWGALLHGHADDEILSHAKEAMEKGTTFGISSPYEEGLARRIVSQVPGMEMIRFVSSGTEATMSAVRLARAFTGKETVIKFQGHYHGHADQFLIHAGSGVHDLPKSSSMGIPSEFVSHTHCLPFNDVESLHSYFLSKERGSSVAAIIVEPVAANMGVVPLEAKFLEALIEYKEKFKFLLIFDEVVTGFRFSLKGAQEIYPVAPDLICLGKIIGGGFPAAAFGGRKEIMSLLSPLGKVYQAGTLSGNPVAMAAGDKAIEKAMADPDFYQTLKDRARLFIDPVSEWIQRKSLRAACQSAGTMWTLFFGVRSVITSHDIQSLHNDLFKRYFLYMLERGVYIPPLHNEAWFISSKHTDEHLKIAAKWTISFLQENEELLR